MTNVAPSSSGRVVDRDEIGAHRVWVAGQLQRGAPGYHKIVQIICGAERSPATPGTGWLQCGRLAVGYTGLLLLFALIPLLLLSRYWLLALATIAGWIYVLRPLQYAINGELAARILAAKAGVRTGHDDPRGYHADSLV